MLSSFFTRTLDSTETMKGIRGFKHLATGCLLCSRDRCDEYDTDPNVYILNLLLSRSDFFLRFCNAVCSGALTLKATDLPSFLWPDIRYNPENIEEELCWGEFLVWVSSSTLFQVPTLLICSSKDTAPYLHEPCICSQVDTWSCRLDWSTSYLCGPQVQKSHSGNDCKCRRLCTYLSSILPCLTPIFLFFRHNT